MFCLKVKIIASVLLVFFSNSALFSQEKVSQVVYSEEKAALVITTQKGNYELTKYSDYCIGVEFKKAGNFPYKSYSLKDGLKGQAIEVGDENGYFHVNTIGLCVKINKDPFEIHYSINEQFLVAQQVGFVDNDTLSGFDFSIKDNEVFFGGGSRVLGMDRRGERLRLYNQASYGYDSYTALMYYSLPIAISENKYMLVFDNGADGYMDVGATSPNTLRFEATGGKMAYYIVAAEHWQGLIKNYTSITGNQSIPPRWVFGNISSRMGYHSQKEVEKVAALYRLDSIPLDAIVLDLFWFGTDLKGYVGNLSWDYDSFPQPEKMMEELEKVGIKTVLITEPFVIEGTKKYEEVIRKNLVGTHHDGTPYMFDFFFGRTSLLDIFKPETKQWFWAIYKDLSLSGVDGWWGDLGEPEVHPNDMQHVNGEASHLHNYYGHEWAKMLYEGYIKDFPDKRPSILMRAGFAGSQRYGMIPWSGDVNRSWAGLKSQIEISLQMGMQGLAYMHSDLGGFAGDYNDAELYTRWLQYGVFQPVFRTHAQESVPPEPVFWDSITKAICKRFIELRYSLTPYNYTLAYENSINGSPFMRPLFYYEDKPDLYTERYSYLWGDNLLISPVLDKGQPSMDVYLPGGIKWFDFWNDKLYEGGQKIKQLLEIETIPVYVKAGSFIPKVPIFQNMDEYTTSTLELHYYHDPSVKTATGYMYSDDGQTPNSFLKNKYEILQYESVYTNKLAFNIKKKGHLYTNSPKSREIQLIVHNFTAKPIAVLIDGSNAHNWTWEDNKLYLSFRFESEINTVNVQIN